MSESFAEGLVGIVLDGRYRLDALLGEGGMGAVYRAHHLAMDRRVAVKLLKPHLTTDDAALQRFVREARSTMKVESDHAVKVLDFGVTPERDYYMVLEYLDGRTVQRELDIDGPFAPARVLHIAKQALRALGAAHAVGLIHRDIKPDNLILMHQGDDPDFAKVLDFGVAKLMDGAAQSSRSAMAITQAGMVFGTPEYMSPEQACGQALDGRSDLYALAATMFAMLTGCGMYNAKTAIEWLTHHARTPPPHLAEGAKELAPYTALDQALQRCLAKRREDRPQTAQQMIALLESVEPTLRNGGALPHAHSAASSSAQGHAMSAAPSSYIAAIDPNATLLPGTPVSVGAPAATPNSPYMRTMMPGSLNAADVRASLAGMRAMPSTTTGMIAEVKRRRGVWTLLGIASIAAVVVAVVIGVTHGKKRDAVVSADGAGGKVVEAAPADATVAATAVADAPPAVTPAQDGGVAATGSGSGSGKSTPKAPTKKELEAAKLVAEAEEGLRINNRLKELANADSALQLDPRNVRARFLLADALIKGGDLDRGCKYLRDLGRNPTARARAAEAGCPK